MKELKSGKSFNEIVSVQQQYQITRLLGKKFKLDTINSEINEYNTKENKAVFEIRGVVVGEGRDRKYYDIDAYVHYDGTVQYLVRRTLQSSVISEDMDFEFKTPDITKINKSIKELPNKLGKDLEKIIPESTNSHFNVGQGFIPITGMQFRNLRPADQVYEQLLNYLALGGKPEELKK